MARDVGYERARSSRCSAAFRRAVRELAPRLIKEVQGLLRRRKATSASVVLVIILRSGIALLKSALRVFPATPVAVLGLRRDEKTARARWYYENIPPLKKTSTVVILDPMLATGGSASQAVRRLVQRGASRQRIYFAGVVSAPEGLRELARIMPRENVVVYQRDNGLDARKYIVPGLGDFGDRYFGYSP